MKISPAVLKLMLAGTSGLGLAVGVASAMTPVPNPPIAVSENAVAENSTIENRVPLELVPPESLTSPVELGARIEVAVVDNSVTPKEELPAEDAPDETAPAPTPTPAPQPPTYDPCPACGMG